MADELQRRLREIQSRQTRTFDQQLCEFKVSFQALTGEGQQRLKQWLTRADQLSREVPSELGLDIRIHVDHVAMDSEGEVNYEGHGNFMATILLKAIEAWERGEDFTPSLIGW